MDQVSVFSSAETEHVRPPLEASGLSLPEGGRRVGAKALCPGTLEGHSPLRTTGLKYLWKLKANLVYLACIRSSKLARAT